MIAPLRLEHVDQVARLHCAALTGLLSELGEASARAFYTGCMKAQSSIGFVHLEQGKVRGFVLGFAHPDKLKKMAARSNPAGTLAGLCLALLRRPRALISLLRSLRGPDEGGYDLREAELTYLAVSPECHGSGVGGNLVDAFTRAMRDAGISTYELSVNDDNTQAIAFYEKIGFRPIGCYREFDRWYRRYRLPE